MTDYTPTWLDEPYPLDHTITWREHLAQKQERDERGSMNTITELATRIANETDTRRVAVLDVLRWLDRKLGQATDQITDEDDCEPGTRDWWVENANVNDAEDCEACEGELCPVHYGISMGIDLMAKKIAALGDDPELFALIPDPVKAPGGDDD